MLMHKELRKSRRKAQPARMRNCPMQVLKPELAHEYGSMSLGEYVQREGYSEAFIRSYLLPMCAAVWSVPNAQVDPHAISECSIRALKTTMMHVPGFLPLNITMSSWLSPGVMPAGHGVPCGDTSAILGKPPPAGPDAAPSVACGQRQELQLRPQDPSRYSTLCVFPPMRAF